MYEIGDLVVHPGHGGCVVKEITTRRFGGVSGRYYTLLPKTDTSTVLYAPVDAAEKIGIRGIISEEQADEVLHYYADVEPEWIKDFKARRTLYADILKSGTLSELAKMVKELLAQGSAGKLNGAEKDLLPRASKKLFSELALAKGVDFEQVYMMARELVPVI